MGSIYIRECSSIAFASIKELLDSGIRPNAIEISSDVWGMIQFGGINMVGRPVFAGLDVIERHDMVNHIKAVYLPPQDG